MNNTTCPDCNGSRGEYIQGLKPCNHCGGYGWVTIPNRVGSVECSVCGGTGLETYQMWMGCGRCGGSGTINV